MVVELRYKRPSSLRATAEVILEPELSQPQLFFQAQITDSRLVAELFYRLHRVSAITEGRVPLTESGMRSGIQGRWRWYHDPVITVQEGGVAFETFSLDLAHYAKVYLNESAFQNVEHWDTGVTNVDFSKDFVNQIRKAKGSLQNIIIDPEGLEVQSDRDAILEKKIPLPASWEAALGSIRGLFNADTPHDSQPTAFLKNLPFPQGFLKAFTKPGGRTWQQGNQWNVTEFDLRDDLGTIAIVASTDVQARFDGRKNVNFKAVKKGRALRQIKANFLTVEQINPDHYRVTGGSKPHIVTRTARGWWCDCLDFLNRGVGQCKHIIAALRPPLKVTPVSDTLWTVSGGDKGWEHAVTLENNVFTCECADYQQYNTCQHVLAVQKELNDYQYRELKGDVAGQTAQGDSLAPGVPEVRVDEDFETALREIVRVLFIPASHVRIGRREVPILVKTGPKPRRSVEFALDNVPYRVVAQDTRIVKVYRYGQLYARLANNRLMYVTGEK